MNIKEFSEIELINEARSGNKDAAEELVRAKWMLLKRVVRPYYLAGGETEDLIQEAFFGFMSAVRNFNPNENVPFDAYATDCMKRHVISVIKKEYAVKRQLQVSNVSLDELIENNVVECGLQYDSEACLIDKIYYQQTIKAFTEQLSKLESRVLNLYLGGFSYSDIAAKLGKSEKSIDNAVQRIKHKLSDYLSSGDISVS